MTKGSTSAGKFGDGLRQRRLGLVGRQQERRLQRRMEAVAARRGGVEGDFGRASARSPTAAAPATPLNGSRPSQLAASRVSGLSWRGVK